MALSEHEIRLPPIAWAVMACAALALVVAHARVTVLLPDAARFSFDSAEYALAGRAWLETGRLVTPFVHPAALGESPGPPYPLLAGHPLVPALNALTFACAGARPGATLVPAMLAYIACVLLTARMGLALAGSRLGGIGAGAAFACSPWALRFATEGLSEMPFATLLTAAFLLLWQLPRRPRPVALGVALGLAHLARPVAVPLLPAFVLGVVLLVPRAQLARVLVRAALGFVPLASLTGLYKLLSTGNAASDVGNYLLLTGVTPEYVVSRLNRMAPPPDALAWIRLHPAAWLAKFERNLRSVTYGAWLLAGRWPGTFATLSVFAALARGKQRSRGFVLAFTCAAGLLTLLGAASVADSRMLFPLLPVTIALGTAGVARFAEVLGRGRRTLVALAVLLATLTGALQTARDWRASLAGGVGGRSAFHERAWREVCSGVRPLLPAGVLVASDAAPWVAWFTHHPVTLVPLAPADLVDGPERLRPGAVVLTNEWLAFRPGEEEWRAVLEERQTPPGFRVAGRVRSGTLEALVLTRLTAP